MNSSKGRVLLADLVQNVNHLELKVRNHYTRPSKRMTRIAKFFGSIPQRKAGVT